VRTVCRTCSKVGHTEAVCQANSKHSTGQTHSNTSTNNAHNVSDDYGAFDSVGVVHDSEHAKHKNPVILTLTIDDKPVKMTLDTGAPYAIISAAIWTQLGSPPLQPAPELFACTNHSLNVTGQWTPTVTYRNQTEKVRCVVAGDLRNSLCGLEWIRHFQIIDLSTVEFLTSTP
jgi:hypothetical protein